jgi:hypothetical protein
MHETYRMLGREHEADLEREAVRLGRASEPRGSHRLSEESGRANRENASRRLTRSRIAVYLLRMARAEN